MPAPASFAAALWRGFRRRCPRCDAVPLFQSYLRPVDACNGCGEPFGSYRADDAPPWLTILVTGHVVVPVVVFVEKTWDPPAWAQMIAWPALTLAVALALLPRAKGVVLAFLWANRAEGGPPPD